MIGSFGATSVLIYGVINSPLAQPRNVIGGHVICAFVGVTVNHLIPSPWIASALAVSGSIVLMQITKTLHPPGGATALIAIIGSEKIQSLGYFYIISPVCSGIVILLAVAMIFITLPEKEATPEINDGIKSGKENTFDQKQADSRILAIRCYTP